MKLWHILVGGGIVLGAVYYFRGSSVLTPTVVTTNAIGQAAPGAAAAFGIPAVTIANSLGIPAKTLAVRIANAKVPIPTPAAIVHP